MVKVKIYEFMSVNDNMSVRGGENNAVGPCFF